MFIIFSLDSFEYKYEIESNVYLICIIIIFVAINKPQALAAINPNLSETIPATTTHDGEDMRRARCFYF